MSHVTRCKVAGVKNVDPATLEQAIRALAAHLGGEVRLNECPTDWMGKTDTSTWGFKPCAMMLVWPSFKNGLGIDVEDGQVAFTTDWYGHEQDVKRVQAKVTEFYTALRAQKILQRMGGKVTTSQATVAGKHALVIAGVV